MPAPAAILSHGEIAFRMRADVPRRRAQELHELEQYWCVSSLADFTVGTAPPDYPKMRIIDIEPLDTFDGSSVAVRLSCEGILGDETWLELSHRESHPEEGWDMLNLVVATLTPDDPRWAKGAQIQTDERVPVAGYQRLWIADREEEKYRAKDFYILSLTFKGLRHDKPFKRRINTSSQTVAHDSYPGIIYTSIYQGFPPVDVGTATFGPPVVPGTMAAEFDLPQISVTDTFVSTTPPPTDYVPGYWIPSDAPTVTIISTGYGDPDAFTYHYPSGWKVLNLQSEQLAGQSIWLISLTWGYQIPATPRTT